MAQRQIKMDRNDKSILIRALHASYRAQKEQGQPRPAEGDLLLRIHAAEPGRLSLSDEEYRMAFSALNRLRNERLAIRLQPPYSEERKRKASESAKQTGFKSRTE